ncbi:MAG: ABC transporter ATP-binding protein, partial [Desulfobulbaceae bacterium]|nr:ABC transporter ATP-binding protein [Desulfobulbaceae bacterium]
KHASEGKTVFLSTHSLEIAEELCDRIAIILQGRIRTSGDLASLKREAHLEDSDLEEVFLELTGAVELNAIVAALRSEKREGV